MASLRIGTRSSPLAMVQAMEVQRALESRGHQTELVPFQTRGDQILDRALDQVGGSGIFTTELESALLAGDVDLAVHSLKDLPTELPAGLVVGAYSASEDPRDVLIAARPIPGFDQIPPGARIGTSSVRRRAFLRDLREDLDVVAVRGNLTSRFRKMEEQAWYGLILAAAGVHRLGWKDRIGLYLDPKVFVPAPGQGIVAVEVRLDDHGVLKWVEEAVGDAQSAVRARAERSVLHALGGGCQMPLGCYATWISRTEVSLMAKWVDGQGHVTVAGISGSSQDPEGLGRRLAERLSQAGN